MTLAHRFCAYAATGMLAEIAWTALCSTRRRWQRRLPRSTVLALEGRTYLWMFPIYGLAVWLFEPAYRICHAWHWLLRIDLYVMGVYAVEYGAGALLRWALGRCPWDYGRARWSVHGLIRLDYAPAWGLYGLLLERVHDAMVLPSP